MTAGNLDLVTWKLLETLGKAVSLETLGMKTRLVRVEEKMVDEDRRVDSLEKTLRL